MATTTRVLVVDDFPRSADRLVGVLQLAGFAARAAYGGEEALSLMADFQPHVLISDVNMPKMSGFELAEICIGQISVCCVLLLTADLHITLEQSEHMRFKRKRMRVELLYKPLSIETLLGFVSACPGGRLCV